MSFCTKPLKTKPNRRALLADERGLSTVEYVIILVLVAAAAIGTWVTFGKTVKEKIDMANDEMGLVDIESAPKR